MPKIFISYRRQDSLSPAGRLYDRLVQKFGADNVFRDLDRIAQGQDFVQAIDAHLSKCDRAVVVIGKEWLGCTDEHGKRRLDDPQDFVAREVEVALQRNIFTVPLLVDGAKMPKAEELPARLQGLGRLNAVKLEDDANYDDSIERLYYALREGKQSLPITLARVLRERMRTRAAAVCAVAVALIAFFFGWMRLFDFLTLDTRVESYTMALAERWYGTAANESVALIAIDAASERALGKALDRSWRRQHAQLLERVSAAGAKAVAFDLWFDAPDPADAQLAAAIARARERGVKVVVGASAFPSAAAPHALFGAAEPALLCIGNRIGYASVAPLAVKRGGVLWSSLALRVAHDGGARGDIDAAHKQLLLDNATGGITQIKLAAVERVRLAKYCPALAKDDVVASFIIPLSALEALRRAPVRTAYHEALNLPASELERRVRGKVVLIGAQLRGGDILNVRGGEERFGMELHADAIEALRKGIAIRPAGDVAQFALTLVLGALGSFLALRIATRPFAQRLVIVLLAAGAYVVLCVWAYAEGRWLLNYLYHLAAFVVSYLSMRYVFLRWPV